MRPQFARYKYIVNTTSHFRIVHVLMLEASNSTFAN